MHRYLTAALLAALLLLTLPLPALATPREGQQLVSLARRLEARFDKDKALDAQLTQYIETVTTCVYGVEQLPDVVQRTENSDAERQAFNEAEARAVELDFVFASYGMADKYWGQLAQGLGRLKLRTPVYRAGRDAAVAHIRLSRQYFAGWAADQQLGCGALNEFAASPVWNQGVINGALGRRLPLPSDQRAELKTQLLALEPALKRMYARMKRDRVSKRAVSDLRDYFPSAATTLP